MICAQKTQLLSYMEEHIAMLELRINLNAESIVPLEAIKIEKACKNPKEFQAIEATLLRNEEANEVIRECELAIHKLCLLKRFLPLLEIEYLCSLFTNYDRWNLREILTRLKYMTC